MCVNIPNEGDCFCKKCPPIEDRAYEHVSWVLEEWRAQRNKHTSCCHNKEEDYQLLKISVYEHRDTKRLYTTEQIAKRERKNRMYYKIDLKNAFLKGFLQQIQGIFIVSVAVNGNHCPNHYIVFDTGRGLIIDPNFERPILLQISLV